jgi:hypothetical protein
MSAQTTSWRCLRGFLWNREHRAAGEILKLTDDQVRELIGLQAIEPVEARDRKGIHAAPRVLWETAAETSDRQRAEASARRLIGSVRR